MKARALYLVIQEK